MSGVIEGMSPVATTQDVFNAVRGLNTHAFDGESEEGLTLRYSRKIPKKEELTFEFTRDPALIHQYFRIYKAECNIFSPYLSAEEEYNRNGHIVIVRLGKLVVGGARLCVSTPRQERTLLLELTGFNICDHFPDMKQKQKHYAEVTRLVVLPEFRSTEVVRSLFFHIGRKAVALGLDIVFGTATLLHARTYRKIWKSIGQKNAVIHFDIDFPPYPGYEEVKYYVISLMVNKDAVEKSQYSSYMAHSIIENV